SGAATLKARLALGCGDDLAQLINRFALSGQVVCQVIRLLGIRNQHHAYAAVKYAPHFLVADLPLLLQPLKNLGHGPSLSLELNPQASRQDTGDIFTEPTPSDVRHAFDLAWVDAQR